MSQKKVKDALPSLDRRRTPNGRPLATCPCCGREVWLTRTAARDGAMRIRVHASLRNGPDWCPGGAKSLAEAKALADRTAVAPQGLGGC